MAASTPVVLDITEKLHSCFVRILQRCNLLLADWLSSCCISAPFYHQWVQAGPDFVCGDWLHLPPCWKGQSLLGWSICICGCYLCWCNYASHCWSQARVGGVRWGHEICSLWLIIKKKTIQHTSVAKQGNKGIILILKKRQMENSVQLYEPGDKTENNLIILWNWREQLFMKLKI